MRLLTARHAADLLAPMIADMTRETLAVAMLDADRRLLGTLCLDGGGDHVTLPIRDIMTHALRLDARGLVVAHNHPSGDASPSQSDIDATRRLAEAAGAVEIVLHDHLIVTPDDIASFRGLGLI